ncbi:MULTISPECIES: DJ-1/PfpI family protein [Clostridia]|uniref:DJ-1/PfpI family protein n=1 Tax=Clostridia TaxID=186801 RepID=UPI001314FC40|nr:MULTISPECIES: DJ-1/PfpI family protein [Clostridia]
MKKKKIGILLFDYVDILDFAGPAEVLSLTTNNKAEQMLTLYKKQLLPIRPFEVKTITETGEKIKTHAGISVEPDYSIHKHPDLNILIISGGPLRAVEAVAKNEPLQQWILMHKHIEYICSVCTGAFILGETGLLNGKRATTHYLALHILQKTYPNVKVAFDCKVVHDGNIISSGGVSSGINMALYLVEQIMGKTVAERTAKTIEYHK